MISTCSTEFLVILNYPAITNISVVDRIIRYNGVFAITNIFFGTVTLRYSGVSLYLANEFWVKWKIGYLHTLQARQKWVSPSRKIREDDVVLVKDENLPRNQWQLARVVRTYPSDEGLVRRVKILLADSSIDDSGRTSKSPVMLERAIQKLVLLVPSFEDQP